MGLLDFVQGFLGKANAKFIAANPVSEDKKPLLGTGAIIVSANEPHGWTPQTLKINPEKLSPDVVLCEFWGVESKEEAEALIEALLSVGGKGLMTGCDEDEDEEEDEERESREQIDGRLSRYLAGEDEALSEEEGEMMDAMVKLMEGYEFGKETLTRATIDRVRKTVAWDIERAAFIARCAYNCGWFTEDEAWKFLRKTRHLAEEHFENWRDYAISFIKGRAIVMCHSDFSGMSDIWNDACMLMEAKWGDVWGWCALKQA